MRRVHGHVMKSVTALPCSPDSADTQIDVAVLRLVDLFARQAARELAVDVHEAKEMADAAQHQKDN